MPALDGRILRKIYGRSPEWFRAKYSMWAPHTIPKIQRLEYYNKEMIVGLVGDPESLLEENKLVLGGVCIDHCNGDRRKLTFQVLADVWAVLVTARYLNAPALIFVSDYEEVLCNGESSLDAWNEVGQYVYSLVQKSTALLGGMGITVARTIHKEVNEAIEAALQRYAQYITADVLRNLYRVNYFGKKSFVPVDRIISWKRNLMTYLPEIAYLILGKTFQSLIVAANLQQIRAFVQARKIYRLAQETAKTSQIVFVPSPSLGGRERMSRSNRHQMFVSENIDTIRTKLSSAHPLAQEYWTSIVPTDILQKYGGDVALALHQASFISSLGAYNSLQEGFYDL